MDNKFLLNHKYILTHRPIECNHNYINIHGHTHSQKDWNVNHICVSVEMIGYRPVSLETIERY